MSTQRRLSSTIIATHNRPAMLVRTLNHLVRQSYRPLEIVVVDDGSKEETAAAVKKWQAEQLPADIAFQYHWQINQGPATARNKGIEISNGELIQFHDDDDLMNPDAIERLAAALDGHRTAIAMASHQYWASGRVVSRTTPPPTLSRREILKSMIAGSWFVPIHGYLFTRCALERIGPWNPALPSQEDDEYLLRAALAQVNFIAAPAARVHYCQHDGIRRATPGKPGESVWQGKIKRMLSDVAIRESAFETLKLAGQTNAYRDAFRHWDARLAQRYPTIRSTHLPRSQLVSWLRQTRIPLDSASAQRPASNRTARFPQRRTQRHTQRPHITPQALGKL